MKLEYKPGLTVAVGNHTNLACVLALVVGTIRLKIDTGTEGIGEGEARGWGRVRWDYIRFQICIRGLAN